MDGWSFAGIVVSGAVSICIVENIVNYLKWKKLHKFSSQLLIENKRLEDIRKLRQSINTDLISVLISNQFNNSS